LRHRPITRREPRVRADLAETFRSQVDQAETPRDGNPRLAPLGEVGAADQPDIERVTEGLDERAERVLRSVEDSITSVRGVEAIVPGPAKEGRLATARMNTNPRPAGLFERERSRG
jgi:hypothetical protein